MEFKPKRPDPRRGALTAREYCLRWLKTHLVESNALSVTKSNLVSRVALLRRGCRAVSWSENSRSPLPVAAPPGPAASPLWSGCGCRQWRGSTDLQTQGISSKPLQNSRAKRAAMSCLPTFVCQELRWVQELWQWEGCSPYPSRAHILAITRDIKYWPCSVMSAPKHSGKTRKGHQLCMAQIR